MRLFLLCCFLCFLSTGAQAGKKRYAARVDLVFNTTINDCTKFPYREQYKAAWLSMLRSQFGAPFFSARTSVTVTCQNMRVYGGASLYDLSLPTRVIVEAWTAPITSGQLEALTDTFRFDGGFFQYYQSKGGLRGWYKWNANGVASNWWPRDLCPDFYKQFYRSPCVKSKLQKCANKMWDQASYAAQMKKGVVIPPPE